jgi:hypothetical protein
MPAYSCTCLRLLRCCCSWLLLLLLPLLLILFLFHLQAGAFDDAPTCSWYYIAGQKVVDSQGFVCECDSGQIWDTTFGTNTERT